MEKITFSDSTRLPNRILNSQENKEHYLTLIFLGCIATVGASIPIALIGKHFEMSAKEVVLLSFLIGTFAAACLGLINRNSNKN